MATAQPKNAKTAAAPKAAPQAAPTNKPDAAGVKEKKTRVDYNGSAPTNEDGKLTAVPTDWVPGKFKPLGRKDFANEADFWEFKAILAEKLVGTYKQRAEVIRKGGGKDAAKAKKLLAMQKKMAELRAQLEADGIDVAGILASMEPADKTEQASA